MNNKAIPEGYMEDRKGRLVPLDQVSDYDIELDVFVRRLVALAKAKQQELSQFKTESFQECYAWLDLIAEKYGRRMGGAKGNVSFTSFDGSLQVSISMQDSITFGPELQIAKAIIDELLSEWSQGANENLKAIIMDAFEVDKEGKLNIGRILSLRRIAITDPRWLEAMNAIADSVLVSVSKKYLNFKEKNSSGKMENISLDIAAI